MKIDFSAKILGLRGDLIYPEVQNADIGAIVRALNGVEMSDNERVHECRAALSNKIEPLTLGNVAVNCLMQQSTEEITPDAKVKRFKLAVLAQTGGVQDVDLAQVAELKTLIGKMYGPLVVGRAYELIDP